MAPNHFAILQDSKRFLKFLYSQQPSTDSNNSEQIHHVQPDKWTFHIPQPRTSISA